MISALDHLAALVALDTRNPPRHIAGDGPLVTYLRAHLGGFDVEVTDHGAGSVTVLAVRGRPRLLFNVHLDTVPAADGYGADPHTLVVADGRATGLGAADTKGCAAALLAAVQRAPGDLALLFTTDEEAGAGVCVRAFCETLPSRGWALGGVIVGEPTSLRAVVAHRGMATSTGHFTGVPGHASNPRALVDSALHEAVRWAHAALQQAAAEERVELGGMTGVRFNLGTFAGGRKSNMIAEAAELRFAVRPRPGESPEALLERFRALAQRTDRVAWSTGFVGGPLPAPGRAEATALARRLGLEVGPPVDFWSEASIFSAAGVPALVYGPGEVAQAHAPDEFVDLAALQHAEATYVRILDEQHKETR